MFKRPLGIILLALLLSSCNEEQALTDSVRRLNISFADSQTRSTSADMQTRSIWNDQTDTEANKVSYIWKDGINMLTAIKHGGQYVPFYESISSAATIFLICFSMVNVKGEF